MHPILIAHRCGPGVYPEQSIMSARHALSIGADMVEMDIQYTKDGRPVICHDPSALRMFGVDRLVKDMTFQEFMTLRQTEDPSFPSHSLGNVLDCNVHPLLLHCKITGAPLEDLAERTRGRDAVIGVQQAQDVDIIRAVAPDTNVLSFMPHLDQLDSFLSSNADFIRLWEDWVTPERVNQIHQAKKKVWIMAGKQSPKSVGYTDSAQIRYWVGLGVDGILVNDIEWAKKVLESC